MWSATCALSERLSHPARHEGPAVLRQGGRVNRKDHERSLRRVPGNGADLALTSAMEDASPRVRITAIDAISERVPNQTLVAAVQNAALNDQEFGVRIRAVRTAADWLDSHPELLQTIRKVADEDPSADIRRIAGLWLDAPVPRN